MRGFFMDDAGDLSCMRLTVFVVTISVLGMWVWGNFAAGQYVPLGTSEAGLLGAAYGCKAWQARSEFGPGTGGTL